MKEREANTYADPDGLETVEAWECAEGCPVRELDLQSGELTSGTPGIKHGGNEGAAYGAESRPPGTQMGGFGDTGGASRFFYVAKSSRAERSAGLNGDRNVHPTCKPVTLMRWLVRLVTPPGATILDPFVGSGTTGIAAVLEGFDFIGIEREPEYVEIAKARIAWWDTHKDRADEILALSAKSERERQEHVEAGQLGLEL